MKYANICAACDNVFLTEKDQLAEFEKMTGMPFDPNKVAMICDECSTTAGYDCDMCGERFLSSPQWSNEHARVEFEIMFGKPLNPENAAVLCDDCYHMAMKEVFPDGLAHH